MDHDKAYEDCDQSKTNIVAISSNTNTITLQANTPHHEQYRTFVSHGTLKMVKIDDLSDEIISPLGRVMTMKPEEVAREVILEEET